MTTFFAPDVIVIVPAAGSIALTMPPTPFTFQSACCAACICAMSADLITTTCRATKLSGVSPARTAARSRSPTAMSENCAGLAVFKSVLPTAICCTLAPSGTMIVTVGPASVASVTEVPDIAFTVPSLAGIVAAAGAGAGVCAGSVGPIPPTTVKRIPRLNAILSELFRTAISILIERLLPVALPRSGHIEFSHPVTGLAFRWQGKVVLPKNTSPQPKSFARL